MRKCLCKLNDDLQTVQVLDLISRLSLNNIRIVIDGVMSVETGTLPAKIESVEFKGEKGGKTDPKLWAPPSTPEGTIKGAYLTGGTPEILNAHKYIEGIKAVSEGSSDQALKFVLTLKAKVPDETELTFVVQKKIKDNSGVEKSVVSAPKTYQVHYASVSQSQPPASTDEEAPAPKK